MNVLESVPLRPWIGPCDVRKDAARVGRAVRRRPARAAARRRHRLRRALESRPDEALYDLRVVLACEASALVRASLEPALVRCAAEQLQSGLS